MKSDNKKLGTLGENIARQFLRKNGYRFIGQNVRTKIGEIDLVMRDKNDIVVIEVKTKSGPDFGTGAEMVGYYKRRKLISLATELLQKYPGRTVRIDVVEIDTSNNPPKINHIKNAVENG